MRIRWSVIVVNKVKQALQNTSISWWQFIIETEKVVNKILLYILPTICNILSWFQSLMDIDVNQTCK